MIQDGRMMEDDGKDLATDYPLNHGFVQQMIISDKASPMTYFSPTFRLKPPTIHYSLTFISNH